MSPKINLVKWLNIGAGIFMLMIAGAFVISIGFNIAESRRVASRTHCAANLKGLASMTAIYARNWNDQLPTAPPDFHGIWLCDQPTLFKSATAAPAGIRPPEDQCRSNVDQIPAILAGNPAAGYVVSGYAWTNDRSTASGAAMPMFPVTSRVPPLTYHEHFTRVKQNSMAELAVDWIISNKPAAAGASWTGFTSPTRAGTYDTSHMEGRSPAGANVVCFDGHVAWRKFDPTHATPVQQGATAAPYFWFVDP